MSAGENESLAIENKKMHIAAIMDKDGFDYCSECDEEVQEEWCEECDGVVFTCGHFDCTHHV